MDLLAEFINLEINDHTRKNILDAINLIKAGPKSFEEMIFNRYSLQIFSDHVIISDDIIEDNEDLNLALDDFIKALETSKK